MPATCTDSSPLAPCRKLNLLERYQPQSRVNQGAFATVVTATDASRNSDQLYAIKLIHPTRYRPARARREAAIHSLFSHHPHVIKLHDWGEIEDTFALVMELAVTDLLECIVPDVGLGEEAALRYGLQVASALEYMHSKGYVHRDVKPENIAVMEDGTARLIDFGHATAISEVGTNNAQAGTSQYLPPECVAGRPSDPTKIDVWALAVCLFAAVTGRFPWLVAGLHDNEYQHWANATIGPQNRAYWMRLSPRMLILLRKCLEPDPAKRWSASQLLQYLRASAQMTGSSVTEKVPHALTQLAGSVMDNDLVRYPLQEGVFRDGRDRHKWMIFLC